MSRVGNHVRSNVVGYVAIFIALSSTAYAVDGSLPGRNTVGTADIINGEVSEAEAWEAYHHLDLDDHEACARRLGISVASSYKRISRAQARLSNGAGNIGGLRTNATGNIGGLRTNAAGNIGGLRTNAAGNIGGLRTNSTQENVDLEIFFYATIAGLIGALLGTSALV